ncbi:hypothetical protein SRABI84_05388 [Peribacillus simplex]|uniref:hypothetical protein n=1 Tax=Peribacillus simplex TaxID=1478 RepID=UPI001DFB3937|nr:hypothetical protein [Peribacillus simplex]CAH0323921.1 hypothetical protein SRABI84_05388 [Peribacillus simplex]
MFLSLEYILLDPNNIKERAHAYYVGYQSQQREAGKLALCRNELDNNERGKIEQAIEHYEATLKQKYLVSTVEEWERNKSLINKRHKKNSIQPKWHSIMDQNLLML